MSSSKAYICPNQCPFLLDVELFQDVLLDGATIPMVRWSCPCCGHKSQAVEKCPDRGYKDWKGSKREVWNHKGENNV